MDTKELQRALAATLEDGRLSRTERQALGELLAENPPDVQQLAQLRARAFSLAKARVSDPRALEALEWVEDLVKLLARAETAPAAARSHACFSPGDACLRTIIAELDRARQTADVCVFTVTDDRIAQALLTAHRRGVKLRLITDNDKQYDVGSDIERLRREGVLVKVDETEHHMHHKFAVLDGATLLNGSYNWTRSAAAFNEENLVLTTDAGLVRAFARHFEGMWAALLGH